MLFPSPVGCFHRIIKKQKKEPYVRGGRSLEDEVEIIQKAYASRSSEDDNMKRKKKKKKVRHSNETTIVDNHVVVDIDPFLILKGRPKIEKGKKLKFKRLLQFLSNNGRTNHLVRFQKGQVEENVDFDSLTGKQLLICCFQVPMFSDSYVADRCRALIEAYDHGQPFELVAVVKMRTDVASYDQKAAFNHFYSAFSSCLAVPFSDFETRHYICACFGNSIHLDQEKVDCAILVDPNGLILEAGETLDNFLYYGSEWSPTLDEIDEQDHVLRCRFDPIYASRYVELDNNKDRSNLSLYRDILLCNPHRTLRRFESSNVGSAASTVLELSTKYVGLYLCFDGRIIEKIKAVHDHCLANEQQLEIVLVCMSLLEEPAAYYKYLFETLRLFNIKSWFLFDYDGKVCRRLWRVFGFGEFFPGEKFIVVPPNCESGELFGREVVTYNGVTEYPFTRSAIVKRRLEHLKSLTPLHSTLFKAGLSQKGEEFDSKQLRGKNLILYLDGFGSKPKIYFDLLMEHYPKMKGMGWEVVYVPLDVVTYADHYVNRRMEEWDVFRHHFRADSEIEKMPWPVMSPSASVEASIKEIMAFPPNEDGEHYSRLVAVRKDGNIVSRGVEERLESGGVTESLFDDVLESDLAFEMNLMPKIEDIGNI